MDGTARGPDELPKIERSFEWSRLSGQFVSLAYEQAVAMGRGIPVRWSKASPQPSEVNSSGMNQEWRWAVGG